MRDPSLTSEVVRTDLTVVGGGLAGVCAAIAAARLGRTVALVQNRPVLGGNSSSEVRVWVVGATGHGRNRFARETGIMGELFVENQYRNPEGNPYYWDLVVLEAVRAESNIQLFLNTDVREVDASGPPADRRIESVTGQMMGSERRIRFEGSSYLDCTGDGLVGFLAGADYRIGREARGEYDEPWAPEVADDITLGSTMLFYSKDTGKPVKFVPPSFAKDITQTPIPDNRIIRTDRDGCFYWWIEWGAELDAVHDNERIRDELWSVIYGIWDYIKNSGKYAADTLTLEWVGSVPGKREYRRFVGDYTLTQHDIVNQALFEDTVAFGGWSIDLHPPGGVYATERGAKHWHADGNYHIPLRCLYSVNVENLWFAGRDISASHVAFGSTRVMATCAVIGEAAGSAAALAYEKGVTPRQLARDHIGELQQVMLRADAALLGVGNDDPDDLARRAAVTASSTLTTLETQATSTAAAGTQTYRLIADVGVIVPVDPELTRFGVLVEASARTELTVEVFDTGAEQNYVPHKSVSTVSCVLDAGPARWIDLDVSAAWPSPGNAFIIVRSNPDVALILTDVREPGVLCFERRDPPYQTDYPQPSLEWRELPNRQTFCLRAGPRTQAYQPDKATGGFARPYGGPQMWASEPMRPGKEERLELRWPEPVPVAQIELVFDDDVNEDLINLHHHRTPFDIMPTLVRDYHLEAAVNGRWAVIARETANRRRRRVHPVQPVTTDALRIVVQATNGTPRAHIISIRAYSDRR